MFEQRLRDNCLSQERSFLGLLLFLRFFLFPHSHDVTPFQYERTNQYEFQQPSTTIAITHPWLPARQYANANSMKPCSACRHGCWADTRHKKCTKKKRKISFASFSHLSTVRTRVLGRVETREKTGTGSQVSKIKK